MNCCLTEYPLTTRVETEGHMMDGSEMCLFAESKTIHEEFSRGQQNSMWSVHELFSTKMLKENHPGILAEDEVVYGGDFGAVMGSVVQGNVVQGSVVQGSVVQGSVVQGSLVQGGVVQGSVVQGSVVQGTPYQA